MNGSTPAGRPRARRRVARRALAAAAAAAVSATMLAAGWAAPAHAQAGDGIDPASCDRAIYDPARRIAESAAVPASVRRLTDAGVMVRVRVEPGTAFDVDARVAAVEAACPGWQASGTRAPNLLAVEVMPDARRTALYYGAAYAAVLGPRFTSIQADVMNPHFAAGDFASGIAAGLDAVADAIGLAVPSAAPVATAPSGPLDTAATGTRLDPLPGFVPPSNEPPGTESGGGIPPLLVLFGLGAAGVCIARVVSARHPGPRPIENTTPLGPPSAFATARALFAEGAKRRRRSPFGGFPFGGSSGSSSFDSSPSAPDSSSSTSDGGGGSTSW